MKMNLQFFAEGGDGDGNDGNGAGGEGNEGNKGGNQPLSFDDFLKLEGNQAEFDRRVQKATSTAVTNAQDKWKLMHDDKISEAEKLAKMTAEEKAAYENKKLREELDAFKRKDARSDMAKEARKILAEEHVTIPDELLTHLIADDADKTKENVESFTKLLKDAIQDGVKEALKGKTPKGGSGGKTLTKEQIMDIKNPIERQRMIAENIELFQ